MNMDGWMDGWTDGCTWKIRKLFDAPFESFLPFVARCYDYSSLLQTQEPQSVTGV